MALMRVLLAVGVLVAAIVMAVPAGAQQGDDFDISNGHFFTQARGSAPAGTGYAVTDDADIPFWTSFKKYGGVSAVGYPVSHRFKWKGFVSQAFQKVVFQFRPDQGGAVIFVNVFDELTAAAKDDWLSTVRDVPNSEKWEEDRGKPWDDVVKNHMALLDKDPAIKSLFLADPNPQVYNGLPMSYKEFQNVAVLRAQRKVFQRWKIDVPWAKAGQVLVANGGDIGKEAGLYPKEAIEPKLPPEVPALVSESTPTPVPPTPTPTAPPVTATPTTAPATATPTAGPTSTAAPVSQVAPGAPTPNPLSAACNDLEHHDERSMLQNANFDGGYSNGVPNGWAAISKGSVRFIEETGYEKFGRASFRVDGNGDFTGVIYQTVKGLQTGKWYQVFYATAQKVVGNGRVDGSLPISRQIGVDPTGGTNPDASTVIWGRASGGQPDKDAGKYGGWKTLGNNNNPLVSAKAAGPNMTVFIRVRGWPDVENGTAWIESAIFIPACDPAFK